MFGWLLLILSCGDPTAPPTVDPGIPVPAAIGDTLVVQVDSAGPSRVFLLRSNTDVDVAVFIQASVGVGFASITDSATRTLGSVAFASADVDPSHLLLHRTAVTHLAAGEAWLLIAGSAQSPQPVQLRLWTYRINRAPETVPSVISAGDTITGESLENSADIDEFQVGLGAGAELIGFLKSAGGTAPVLPAFQIYAPGAGTPLIDLSGTGATEDLEGQSTGLLPIPSAGSGRVVVYSREQDLATTSDGTGPYQLQLRLIDRTPETISVVVPVNDTVVGEQIDHVGDIDEFTANVVAGERYRVFLQTVSGSAGATLRVNAPALGLAVASHNGDSALAANFTDTFSPSFSGPIQLQVEGVENTFGLNRGGYRLFLYHINPLPEVAPAILSAGDSVVTETIEFPGDVDNFTVLPSATGLVNYILRHPGGLSGALQLNWLGNSGPASVRCYPNGIAPNSCGGGTHHIPPVGEGLTLLGDPGTRGGAAIISYAIDTMPEVASGGIVLDLPVTEDIAPAGDEDRFQVHAGQGDLFDLSFSGGSNCSCNSFAFRFMRNAVVMQQYWGSGPDWRTGRFAFPDTGDYTMVVTGNNVGTVVAETGAYQFTLRRVPTGPETAAAALTVTDTVRTESIDSLGDVDDFTVTAPPGAEIVATVTPRLALDALDPVTLDSLRNGPRGATGIVTVPASGQLRLRVSENRVTPFATQQIADAFDTTGSYVLALQLLDRLPESAPVAVTRGVQVLESIDHIGDIDEYSFAGVAGDTVSITLGNLQSYGSLSMLLELLSPVDGSVLATTNTFLQTPITAPTVTLPVTGLYPIRLRSMDDQAGAGSYDFTAQ